ncbi:hypothetical protein PG913_08385 [Tenacibaculum pacificus]|uniref:hypothetical protein n=1 Tax=Tenacibaculum TaxID=104267 RepID=UPI0022F3FF8A|nr:hypothetical protein [Tenacibaculum pacificus]WBX72920.1 hypothetical protein PG913_08385 [Tenacibaculum pacificus]
MKKETKETLEKDNKTYLESNPIGQRDKAQKVLEKAKAQEMAQLALGKKWIKVDGRTEVLR